MNEPTYFYQLPTLSLKFAEAPFLGKEFWPSTCAVWAVTLSQVGRVGAKPEPRWAEAPDTHPPGGLEPSAPSSSRFTEFLPTRRDLSVLPTPWRGIPVHPQDVHAIGPKGISVWAHSASRAPSQRLGKASSSILSCPESSGPELARVVLGRE